MKEFKAGDPVFDLAYGKGTVLEWKYNQGTYPILVQFTDSGANCTFTPDGKIHLDAIKTLYHGHDVQVTVRTASSQEEYEWQILYFSHDTRKYQISACHYKSIGSFVQDYSINSEFGASSIQLFEPSRQLVK